MPITAPEEMPPTRLDRFLGIHSELSRREIREAITQGRVLLGERIIRHPRHTINPGDVLDIAPPPPPVAPALIHIDDDLLVLDKPSGMPTQAPADRKDLDLLRWAQQHHGQCFLHHRLDRPASGLVLLARSVRVNKALTDAFRSHTIERQYQAVLTGKLPETTRWDGPIDGKDAATRATPVGHGEGITAALVTLETGRTHQIRRHAAAAGLPLAGDRRYGTDRARRWPRLALHAHHLSLTHPITGAEVAFSAPVPDDLASLWAEAGG